MVTYQDTQLDALGDGTRRAILARLVDEGPLAVGELARDFPMTRPAISQHLRVLKRAHFVIDRAAGTRRLYAVNPDAIESLREYFESQLAGLRVYANNKAGAAVRTVMRVPNTRKRAPAKPKYQSKKQRSLKWSGRGLMPVWMREEMKGTKLTKDDFLIK